MGTELGGLPGVHARTVAALSAELNEVQVAAKTVSDRYWTAFKARNAQEVGKPANVRQMGRYGPVVTVNSKNRKIYIQWRNWAPRTTGPRKGERFFPKSVSPSARNHRDYTLAQFKGAPPWEQLLINKAESDFQVMREIIDNLHDAITGLNKLARKEKWLSPLNSSNRQGEQTGKQETPMEELARLATSQAEINPLDLLDK